MTENPTEKLARSIGLIGIWMLAINGIIGAGIFGVPAKVGGALGAYSGLTFLLLGIVLAPVLLTIAAVASFFRETGGPVLYTHTAFGPFAAFQTGWAYYITRITAFAANVNLLVSSVGYLWAPADSGVGRIALLVLVIGGLTWVNVIGAKQAMRSVGVLTVLKFVPLLALVLFGVSHLSADVLPGKESTLPPFSDLGSAALLVIYAYVGWENALVPAGEAKNPARDIPRALMLALGISTVLYFLIQSVALVVVENIGASKRPLVDAAEILIGKTGGILLLIGVVVSVGGNLAATMFSLPRVTYAMAREGSLPGFFGIVHANYRTPIVSVIVFGLLAFLLAAFLSFEWLAGMSTVVRLLIYLACIATLPRLQRDRADAPGRLRLPGGPVLPIVAVIVCVALLTQITLNGALATVAFLVLGSVIYLFRPRKAPTT